MRTLPAACQSASLPVCRGRLSAQPGPRFCSEAMEPISCANRGGEGKETVRMQSMSSTVRAPFCCCWQTCEYGQKNFESIHGVGVSAVMPVLLLSDCRQAAFGLRLERGRNAAWKLQSSLMMTMHSFLRPQNPNNSPPMGEMQVDPMREKAVGIFSRRGSSYGWRE